jgi:hypothetical protein
VYHIHAGSFWECIYGFGIGQDSLQVLGVRLPQEPAADKFLVSSLGLYICMFGAINLWLDSLSDVEAFGVAMSE